MSSDYFLVHRGLQVQRLAAQEDGNRIETPGRLSRDGYAAKTLDLMHSVDRICKLTLGESGSSGVLGWVTGRGGGKGQQLSSKQRELIRDFEKQLVLVRLGEDAPGARFAAAVINALLKDYAFFDGLKPLPQHTNQFAYELLYPTWFNLYRAMRIPLPDEDRPRFTAEQIVETFEFLRDSAISEQQSEDALVAAMTFAANRFGLEAADYVRRLVDVCRRDKPGKYQPALTRLQQLCHYVPDAVEFERVLKDWLLVERSIQGARVRRRARGRPVFPAALADQFRQLEQSEEQSDSYQQLLRKLGRIVEHAEGFDKKFAGLFCADSNVCNDLIDLCLTDRSDEGVLSRRAQGLVARLVSKISETPDALAAVRPFARNIAGRTDALEPTSFERFLEEFVDKEGNRKVMLAAPANDEKRQAVSGQLMEAARGVAAPDRFLEYLLWAALIGPAHDQEGLAAIQRSIHVLNMSVAQDSISDRELGELVADLRDHLADALEILRAPAFGGRGKSERLAKMYLTLNEACHQFEATRRVANFGLTKAAYGNLGRLTE